MGGMKRLLVVLTMLGGCLDDVEPVDVPTSEPAALGKCSAVCGTAPVYCQIIIRNTPPTCSCPAPGGLTPLTCDNT